MDVKEKQLGELPRLKRVVKNEYDGFKHNYDRYNEFREFVFSTSLTDSDKTLLMTKSFPTLEFNVLEAYISRMLGEFSKQEPDIEVNADDPSTADPLTIQVVEQHLRHVMNDSKNHHTKYEVYKDLLSGGFSVLKVSTDYTSPMSMTQNIKIERAFDPTLCGFDHMARFSHKGDGRYCFELFPMSREEFEELYPNVKIEELSFTRGLAGFNWSYTLDNSDQLIVCDFYEKKQEEMKIVRLVDGRVMPLRDYNKMVKDMSNDVTNISLPPAIVGKPRRTMIDKIVRYRFIETTVIEYEETDYDYLPLVFVDGNSILLKTHKNGNVRQMTRPYVYHAKGAQRLKNYAGVSLANEIENIVQHKFAVALEALPKEEDLLEAYKDVQKASVLVYNAFQDNNPTYPILNPITPVARTPAPPEILQGFQGADQAIQNILGSYDAQLGINNNQLSGIAIVEAASQSNATAMPYIVGFLEGYQRAAQIYVDLMPKYYVTPRTLPMQDKEGHHYYVKVNDGAKPTFDYDTNALNVVVKAGASFQVQKSRTIMMIKEMMGMSPLFAQFIAEKGLNFVLDNMEGRGIEQLKDMVGEWLQEMQQHKQMAMQMQQQEMQANAQNPAAVRAQVDMQKLQMESQKNQMQHQIDLEKLKIDHNRLMTDVAIAHDKNQVELTAIKDKKDTEMHKIATEHLGKTMDTVLKHATSKKE